MCSPSPEWLAGAGTVTPAEIDKLLSVQAETYPDTAEVYVTNLRRDDEGRTLHAEWLDILSAPVHGRPYHPRIGPFGRETLSEDLLHLCIAMQHLFPEETVDDVESSFQSMVVHVMAGGLHECGAPFIASSDPSGRVMFTQDASLLYRDILKRQPVRYSRRRLEDGEAVWIADPPSRPVEPLKGGRWSEETKPRALGKSHPR